MIIDPNGAIGKALGLTADSFSKHYMCPRCGQLSATETCPKCGSKCNYILYWNPTKKAQNPLKCLLVKIIKQLSTLFRKSQNNVGSVVFVGIDGFKPTNRQYRHTAYLRIRCWFSERKIFDKTFYGLLRTYS